MAAMKTSKLLKAVADQALPNLKLGDVVKIRHSGWRHGRIAELRGSLGPKGSHIYRVLVRRKPKPACVELREDQLELVPVGS